MSAAEKEPPCFTQGPWVRNDKHSGTAEWRIESDATGYPNDGWVIADLHGPDAEANARLIAASPLLFELLDELIAFAIDAPPDLLKRVVELLDAIEGNKT